MLARCEKLKSPNGCLIETPLLLPSFSSKGFPDLRKIMKTMEEHIDSPILISAYDIHHKLVPKRISFNNDLRFIDSGGYECSIEFGLMEYHKKYRHLSWNKRMFTKTIKSVLKDQVPKVIINYDHPHYRKSLDSQIKTTNALFDRLGKVGSFVKEILIKPETKDRDNQYLNINNIEANITQLNSFNIIGVTEKELGQSLIDKMHNICRIRQALHAKKMTQFIHIFGSLDTISTPLYFLCGADIFDGLTWLRYAYREGLTLYQANYWASNYSSEKKDYKSKIHTFVDNNEYLQRLLLDMKDFQKTKDFNSFTYNKELLQKIWGTVQNRMKEA